MLIPLTTKLSAVAIPSVLTPEVTLPLKGPLNVPAVIIPVAWISPVAPIPTPPAIDPLTNAPPICKGYLGSLVWTPTHPRAYMLVKPKPTSISTHCELGKLSKYFPSP